MMSLKGVAIKAAQPDLATVRKRAQAALALCSLIGHNLDAVPDEPLPPGERSSLGGSLFTVGPLFVEFLTEDLLAAPGWYPDLQERATYLAARQAESSAWERLRSLLMFTLDLVSDQYLAAQAECNQEGLAIVKKIEASLQVAEGEERERALDRLYGISRAQTLLREARGQPSRPVRARPVPVDESSLTPRQRAARQRRKEQVTARLYGAFTRVLRTWAAKGGPGDLTRLRRADRDHPGG